MASVPVDIVPTGMKAGNGKASSFTSTPLAPGLTPSAWAELTGGSVLAAKDWLSDEAAPGPALPVRFDDIYPLRNLLSPAVQAASKALTDAISRLNAALEAKDAGDEFVADDQLHHVMADLREAFCHREIGDGYGAIVSAALSAIENLDGAVATVHQLTAIRRRLEAVETEPFMEMQRAVEHIEKLEDADLNVEPRGFQIVANWLLDE